MTSIPGEGSAGAQVRRSPASMPTTDYVLTLSCPDGPGIVHAVSRVLAHLDCNIVESGQYSDRTTKTFFMRVQFEPLLPTEEGGLRAALADVASDFAMSWRLIAAADKQRLLILVSKVGHCLNDLLFRASTGALNVEIGAIVSNHPDLAPMAARYGIGFHHIPVTPATKPDAEAQLMELVDTCGIDLVVLARYMQILSPDLCRRLDGRAINIHHSMLPSFKGARPYQQAYDHGVKVIGATAHYVTSDLDEGPIIEQEVARVDHSMTVEQVTARGRDTESLALARAVHWHTENRVLLHGQRTVVFR